MAKRAHVKHQQYAGEHDGHSYTDSRFSNSTFNDGKFKDSTFKDSKFNDNKFNDSKRGKDRARGKRRQYDENSNIVDLSARSAQLATAYTPHRSKTPLIARTPAQQRYIDAIKHHCLTFGIGPAGTGKSYCAGALAAEALESGRIERIILTRPAVEAGENLGFLPGELQDKYAVYIEAFRDILNERLGPGVVDYCLRHGRIVGAPLAYMRGKTFNDNTFVILDEAQNTTPTQIKMFLTRIGENAKVVINGDIRQSDIRGPNGLADALDRLCGLPGVHIHTFERDDIVRSGLVRHILDRYEG
ncbi:MAG: PhoH family protein [Pseudomonadales bacterium]|jgi:phosphate starvation-inducible PhoH-like protein|nr:PhoH family protein [Pseudomonadales bacterium]